MAVEKTVGTLIKSYHDYRYFRDGFKTDIVVLIYVDGSGKKQKIVINRPKFDYYIIKDRSSPEAGNPPMYIGKDKVDKKTVFYDNLYHTVAEDTGAMDFYNRARFSGEKSDRQMRCLLKHNWLYNADQDIEDYCIGQFYQTHKPDPNYAIRKFYFDTEVDFYSEGGLKGKMYPEFPKPEIAPCPFNVITLIDGNGSECFTFILRNQFNPELSDFEKDRIDSFKQKIAAKVSAENKMAFKFNFFFFNDELSMLKGFFGKVHEKSPDYLCGWNAMGFDIPYILNRLRYLLSKDKTVDTSGYHLDEEVAKIVCDPEYLEYTDDSGVTASLRPHFNLSVPRGDRNVTVSGKRIDATRRFDWFDVLDGTCWIDQMQLFSNSRIQKKFDSYKLDSIASDELGRTKCEFTGGQTIQNQIYLSPDLFIEYNINDVMLLDELENKNKDIDEFQNLADTTLTRRSKVFSKSIALVNYIMEFADERNLVMQTNKNASYGELSSLYDKQYLNRGDISENDKRYFDLLTRKDRYGAFVSDPNGNDSVGEKIVGKPSNRIFRLVCDEDFSSLYPSIIRSLNVEATHIDGKFYLIDDDTKKKLKQYYGCGDMFKLSIKDAGASPSSDDSDDASSANEDDDASHDSDDDAAAADEADASPKDETDDVGVVLSDFIMSQNWCRLGDAFMDLPTTEDISKQIDAAIEAKKQH